MTDDRMEQLLDRIPNVAIAVIGDFFLDKYLVLDDALTEISLETGREAYQVVAKRLSPGAAGTVTNNLSALDVGEVYAVGFIGDDGEGYELKRGLSETGVDLHYLIEHSDLFTPTYTKPMLRDADGDETELNRLDIKNREPTPPDVEQQLTAQLQQTVETADAVIIADQVGARDEGVITDGVRETIANISADHSDVVFFADSRENIGLFDNVMIKPNTYEAAKACGYEGSEEELSVQDAQSYGRELVQGGNRPVFVTIGAGGIMVFDSDAYTLVEGIDVAGPIDIVGAGDSCTAGIVSALCSGASPAEAAVVGNCVASLTVQQLGTTGTTTRRQVLERFRENEELYVALE